MILKKYEKLPEFLKNDKVKEYYSILSKKKISLMIKRILDIFFALLILIILSPLMIIIAICIKIDSKGPVFYKQERVTIYNKTFRIFKFRTMCSNADKIGSLVTTQNDNRITRIGKIIRKIRFDEFPQLFNIIKGDMTFVGTRPEVKKYVEKYTDEMKATLLMRAGVTSIASIQFKDEDEILDEKIKQGKDIDKAYIEDVLPKKMKYNIEYIKKFNFLYDIRICIKTLFAIIKKQ